MTSRRFARRAFGRFAPGALVLFLTLMAVLRVLPLINKKYTPGDLVSGAKQIFVLELSAPQDDAIAAKVVEVLKGEGAAGKTMVLDLSAAPQAVADAAGGAFRSEKKVQGVLLTGNFTAAREGAAAKAPAGVLQIGVKWFALSAQKDKWEVAEDSLDISSVWGGSARMLVEAVRYTVQEPGAYFPVQSDLRWGGERALGKLKGRATGCLAADLGGARGRCAIVLADGGDRVYGGAPPGGPPADLTAQVRLATASKAAALGDFDGDGRLDLASWDGRELAIAAQAEDGTFAPPRRVLPLADCLALAAIDVGCGPKAGLLVSAPAGPVLLIPDGQGGFTPRALPGAEAARGLGSGGLCVAADFDNDGRIDVVQLFAKGLLVYAGEKPGQFKPPVKVEMTLVESPTAAVCGDYDGDGFLDLVVCGKDGCTLLLRGAAQPFVSGLWETGELEYHGTLNQPPVVAAGPCDINHDGRQGVMLFYAGLGPMAFFNRGFACFGLARELHLQDAGLKEAAALQQGQATGILMDFNGDHAEDLLAVDLQGTVWWLPGKTEGRPDLGLILSLPPKTHGPLTVAVRAGQRRLGMHVLRPGAPATVGRMNKGPVTLEWIDADGKKRTRQIAVLKTQRVEVGP
jgi:hypothetical protein